MAGVFLLFLLGSLTFVLILDLSICNHIFKVGPKKRNINWLINWKHSPCALSQIKSYLVTYGKYIQIVHRRAASIIECRPISILLLLGIIYNVVEIILYTLVYKCFNDPTPDYILSDFNRTQEFHTETTSWNALPPQIRKENSFSAFKAKLKHISKSTNWVFIHVYYFFLQQKYNRIRLI